ncbi:hypothetical protein JCM10908_002041 [Rhodotorula pacifica]|uniref:C2H2-type zinc finger protein n=1 Tax=Rhodotorula pacifica TaxID=1495444 RepID=UPI00317426B0
MSTAKDQEPGTSSSPRLVDGQGLLAAYGSAQQTNKAGAAAPANPRKRPPSPINVSRQDAQRPFAFARRNSTGLNNLVTFTGSPTSDVRMLPAVTAESATRSTADTALPPIRVVLSPSTTSHAVMTESPVTSLAPMSFSLSSSGGNGSAGTSAGSQQPNRPKGRGTLELERVLDMWAAKTPTSAAFPSSIGLPPASNAASAATSQPFLTHSLVTAEPEALDLAISPLRTTVAPPTSSSAFADFAQLAAVQPVNPNARNSLSVRDSLPRRQRSRSEADLMRLDTMSLGGISLGDFLNGLSSSNGPTSQFSIDLTQPVSAVPTFGGQQVQAGQTAANQGLRLLPPSAPISFNVKTVQTPGADGQQSFDFTRGLELKISQPSPVDGPQQGGLRTRRARSQEPGHRYSKSDDLSHLLSTLSAQNLSQIPPHQSQQQRQAQQQPQQPYLTSATGHLVPPSFDQSQQQFVSQTSDPPLDPALQLLAQQILPAGGQPNSQPVPASRPEFIHLPNGMTLPIAYFAPLPPPPPPQNQSDLPQPSTSAAAAAGSVQSGILPEFSPQGNALALAAAQAAQAHAAQIAQAAAVATMQFSNGGLTGTSDANVHPSFLPDPPGPYNISVGPGGPYSYHSPSNNSLVLPTPPPIPGATNGSKSKRASRNAARTTTVGADFFDPDFDELNSSDGSDDDDDDEDEYEDSPKQKKGKLAPRMPSSSAGTGKKAAPKKRTAPQVPKSAILIEGGSQVNPDGSPIHDDDDEYTRESKTTRATIDAAQRRRNANAVAKFVCELCGETFTRRYNLRGHQRAHKGEKPYKCAYDGCDKSFARAHDCKRHELLHLGVRKYHCSPCKRDFVRLDALHRHHRSEIGQTCVKQLRAQGMPFDDNGAAIM